MRVMIREGSAAKNLDELLPILNGRDSRNCFFVTDDLDPRDIVEKGHIDNLVRTAIAKGVEPCQGDPDGHVEHGPIFRVETTWGRRARILGGFAHC